MATRRANDAARCSPATARRGRLSERAWADVRIAARVARETDVVLRLHGIEIYNKRKPHKLEKEVVQQKQQKPVEAAVLELPLATDGEAPPPPLSKRQRRSAQRLQEFQEKKRAAEVAEVLADPATSIRTEEGARYYVARRERQRLLARRPTPMDDSSSDVSSVEGQPRGEEGPPRGVDVGPKRARVSPPDVGRSAEGCREPEAARGGPGVPL